MNHVDLNDLYLFAQSVEAGSFSAAARKLGLPKATVSRRIGKLEEALGVRLVQRNSRQFEVTPVGGLYYEHCAKMSYEADLAQRMIAARQFEPQGAVRFSCPVEMLEHYVNPMLVEFMRRYPKISLDVLAVNAAVDVIDEKRDFAIRARSFPLPDSDLVTRVFSTRPFYLVASPDLVKEKIKDLNELEDYPCLTSQTAPPYAWTFSHKKHGAQTFRFFHPKLACCNLQLVKQAACTGLGIALLPEIMVRAELDEGILCEVLSAEWHSGEDTFHAVYPSRNGMLPAVRLLLDFLADGFGQMDMGG